MSLENDIKINQLLKNWPAGVVCLTSWLTANHYSNQLLDKYKKSKWLDSIGSGAMIRSGDKVSYEGGVYALQEQLRMNIHPAAKTALAFLGKAHYLELQQSKAVLMGGEGEKLPAWFKKYDWGLDVQYHKSSFLPSDLGLVDVELKTFSIKVSGAARALMECLYLAPEKQDLFECYEIMESLTNLRPKALQELLENCSSVKVNRLFLYMAEKAGHAWFKHINLDSVKLGKGKRQIVSDGVYVTKYQITVPKELEKN
tara:strand:- start:1147 stop:1914 length:768 start_codon:yes stop_codon:yes gene_type:complete